MQQLYRRLQLREAFSRSLEVPRSPHHLERRSENRRHLAPQGSQRPLQTMSGSLQQIGIGVINALLHLLELLRILHKKQLHHFLEQALVATDMIQRHVTVETEHLRRPAHRVFTHLSDPYISYRQNGQKSYNKSTRHANTTLWLTRPGVESEGNFLHKMLCLGIDRRPRSYISAFTLNRDR